MPKGHHLPDDKEEMIWSYHNLRKSPEECHQNLFLGSEAACSHIKKLYTLFSKPDEDKENFQYLANNNCRGVKRGSGSGEQWFDGLVASFHMNNPTGKIFDMRLELGELLGDDISTHKLPSMSSVGRALMRSGVHISLILKIQFKFMIIWKECRLSKLMI